MKNSKFSTRDFIFGIAVGLCIGLLFGFLQLKTLYVNQPTTTTKTEGSNQNLISNSTSETLKTYNTSVIEWNVTSTDGKTFHFKTPNGYSSMTDQYVESLLQSYGISTPEDNIVCIGDTGQQYTSTILINAAPISKVKEIVTAMYADDPAVDLDDFKYSEAYQYMLTGETPEADLGVVITELESITSSEGNTFRVFQVDRDTEYYTDDTMTDTQIIHSTELAAYSEDIDAIEILIYMQSFDMNTAVSLMTEFIN